MLMIPKKERQRSKDMKFKLLGGLVIIAILLGILIYVVLKFYFHKIGVYGAIAVTGGVIILVILLVVCFIKREVLAKLCCKDRQNDVLYYTN